MPCLLRASSRLVSARLSIVPARGLADVPLALVKELRAVSGAPITDCKKALQVCMMVLDETERVRLMGTLMGTLDRGPQAEGVEGNLKKAFEWLRKKGQASVAKNNRAAKEGLVAAAVRGNTGVLVEVNSETDFVARDAEFQKFVGAAVEATLGLPLPPATEARMVEVDVPSLLKSPTPGDEGRELGVGLADLVVKIRENIAVRRAASLSVQDGLIARCVPLRKAMGAMFR
jgi:elongation factor Ts